MTTEDDTALAGRYVLGPVLGRGGMADVHRARDATLGREVAVKLLRDVASDEGERARFKAEARTLARLNHPGLVTVLDAGTDGDQPFLVMELVDGASLDSACAGQALDPDTVASIGVQLARALAYTHAAGVIHRDIKPGNVLIAADGVVKLADFGIARLVGENTNHTKQGMAIGSPAYFSPEQVSGREVTQASDVYSLGLVLLEALTGQRAYQGPSAEAAVARLTTPPQFTDAVPREWRGLLAGMTCLAPDERHSAADVASVLTSLGGIPTGTAETGALAATGTRRLISPVSPATLAGALAPQQTRVPLLQRLRTFMATRRGRSAVVLAAMAATLLLLVVIAATTRDGGGTEPEDQVPDDVPTRMQEPLRELHGAIRGGGE
jgi:serine/threonine protein kinase